MYEHLLKPRTGKIKQEASFLRRAGGFIIDILLIDIFITSPFTGILSNLMVRVQTDLFNVILTTREIAALTVLALIAYTYFVLFEYVLGQTPGMMLMKTSVEGPKLWQPFVRNSFFLPVFPFSLFMLIEPIAILFTKRGVLERLSKTRTLYKKEIIL